MTRSGERLGLVLRASGAAALALAVAGLVLTSLGGHSAATRVGEALCWAAVAVVIAIPVGRVAWLGATWLRGGDRRFAALAGLLIALLIVGSALATVISGAGP